MPLVLEDGAELRLVSSVFLCYSTLAKDQLRTSFVDLDKYLGNDDGRFDIHGKDYVLSAIDMRLVGLCLHAQLKATDGKWRESVVDLDRIVHIVDGTLMPIRDPGNPSAQGFRTLMVSPPLLPGRSESSAEADYTYQPLTPGGERIRCCVIVPGSFHEPIRCLLFERPLHVDEPFVCLSYVWGDAKDNVEILLNNRRFKITRNLWIALCRLRDKGLSMPIWIDAISINQQDLDEKAAQVYRMAHIYNVASEVIIWIGDGPTPSYHDANAHGSAAYCTAVNTLLLAVTRGQHIRQSEKLDMSELEPGETYIDDTELINGLTDFADAAWFRRTWTIQEYTLQHRKSFLYGPVIICPSTVEAFALRYSSHSGFDPRLKCGCFTVGNEMRAAMIAVAQTIRFWGLPVSQVYSMIQVDPGIDRRWLIGLRMLSLSRRCETSDPRDKIYGILGTIGKVFGPPYFKPNYTISTVETYAQFSLHLMNFSQTYDLWVEKETPDVSVDAHIDTVPSWAIDWRIMDDNEHANPHPGRMQDFKFHHRSPIPYQAQVLDHDVLPVEGFHLDTVSKVASGWAGKNNRKEDREEDREVYDTTTTLTNWYELADIGSQTPYFNGESRENVFWRTLALDHVDVYDKPQPWRQGRVDRRITPVDEAGWKLLKQKHIELKPRPTEYDQDAHISGISLRNTIWLAGKRYRPFCTTGDMMGMAPPNVRVGDKVYLIKGSSYPCILRDGYLVLDGGERVPIKRFVALAYVHGVMDGEMKHLLDKAETIHLR